MTVARSKTSAAETFVERLSMTSSFCWSCRSTRVSTSVLSSAVKLFRARRTSLNVRVASFTHSCIVSIKSVRSTTSSGGQPYRTAIRDQQRAGWPSQSPQFRGTRMIATWIHAISFSPQLKPRTDSQPLHPLLRTARQRSIDGQAFPVRYPESQVTLGAEIVGIKPPNPV